MSYPPPPGGQPTSFKTNVNRAKTKRWVEAKSYSYDGDDWGEVDDYDEYGGYDEPQPPPKPTGFRQRGQSATQPAPASRDTQSEDYQTPGNNRQGYGNLAGQPIAPQQHQAIRSTTNPQPRMKGSIERSNSFDRGDDKRAFSAGIHQQAALTSGSGQFQPQGFPNDQSQQLPFQQGPNQAFPSQHGPYQQSFAPQEQYHPPPPEKDHVQISGLPSTINDHQQLQSPIQFNLDQSRHQPGIGRALLPIDNQLGGQVDRHMPEKSSSQASNHGSATYSDQALHPSVNDRTQTVASDETSLDFHNRRDFSPSAIPPPLQTRNSPSPHDASESQSSSRHPPRKSSLSQGNPPSLPVLDQGPQLLPPTVPLDESPASSDREDHDHPRKPLPFVRPADIYKRMQEEKEKARQSQDSSRPSMDRVMEQAGSTPSHEPTGPPPSTDALGAGPARLGTAESMNSRIVSKDSGPPLDSNSSRESEHGLGEPHVDAARPNVPPAENPSISFNSMSRPILPDVTRMSGFGDLLLGTTTIGKEPSQPSSHEKLAPSSQINPQAPVEDTGLQHQPSAGFRSAVSQAFEIVEDQIPGTPSSTAGSGVGRSTSGGTSVISPIISRGPSVAKWSETTMGSERTAPPPSLTENEIDKTTSRPVSSGTLETPKQIVRKPSPSQSPGPGFSEPTPASFIPGHRRNLSTPSPDNSPARTPVLEANRQIRQPQEAELAMVTPTESTYPSNHGPRNIEASFSEISASTSQPPIAGESNQQSADPNLNVRDRLNMLSSFNEADVIRGPRENSEIESPVTPLENIPHSRAESPSKNRVRDLAGKFESGKTSRQGSDLSTGLPGTTTPKKDNALQARPLTDRLESFRPQLPGGWESYTSAAPSKVSSKQAKFSDAKAPNQVLTDSPEKSKGVSTPATVKSIYAESPSKASDGRENSSLQTEALPTPIDAFAAVVAAGSALAEALVAAVGMDSTPSSKEPDARLQGEAPRQESQPNTFGTTSHGHSASANTTVHPEASRPSVQDFDDDNSSAAPTPPLRKESDQTADKTTSISTKGEPRIESRSVQSDMTNPVTDVTDHRPHSMLPPLSTDTRSHQYESDRLRREIVKNLGPRGLSEPTTAESESPWQDNSRLSTESNLARHDSMVIPSEYESYWNGSNSGGEASRTNSSRGKAQSSLDSAQQHDHENIKPPPPLHLSGGHQKTIAEESARNDDLSSRPDLRQHRYSWEQDSGEVLVPDRRLRDYDSTSARATPPSHIGSYEATQDSKAIFVTPNLESHGPESTNVEGQSVPLVNEGPVANKGETRISDILSLPRAQEQPERIAVDQGQDSSAKNIVDHERVNLPKYLSDPVASEVASPVTENHPVGDRKIDYQGIETVSPYTQPLNENWIPTFEMTEAPTEIQNTSPIIPGALPKMPAFREILALKDSAERIRAFNETREQVAHVNSGLSHWLSVTLNELPEHKVVLSRADHGPSAVVTQKSLPFKAKLTSMRSGGAQTNQQPYYQQYLNATPQASGPDGVGGQNPSSSISAQSFAPTGGSGGKLSSQQVQAKGKEFLHSAGVFGGKANVAAKGLFSKGRSKFRGSSSVDKIPNPALSSPDAVTRGMQPQRQPQPEQSFPTETSSPPHSIIQEAPSVPPTSIQSHPPFPEVPESVKEDAHGAIQTQSFQPSPTSEENAPLYGDNIGRPHRSNYESQPLDVVQVARHSAIQSNRLSFDQENYASPGSNQQTQAPGLGDAAPKYVDTTATAEPPLDSYPEMQRWQSNTPTQADFSKADLSNTMSTSPLPGVHTSLPTEHRSKDSYTPAAIDPGFPETANKNNRSRNSLIPHSRYSLRSLPVTDVIQEIAPASHNTDYRKSQGFSADSSGKVVTTDRYGKLENSPDVRSRSGSNPRTSRYSSSQDLMPENATSQGRQHASGLLPHATTRAGAEDQKVPRPFSFMEYSQTQPTQEILQREPSIDSNISHQAPNRQPSPVSPQRSITRDVSDKQERAGPVHYDASHDFVPPNHDSGLLRRPRSFSRPFQDPDLGEHPAFRQDGNGREETDLPIEYYPTQMHHEAARLPRQQTTEYQLEGVGPPSVQLSGSKSRSRRSSRSSVFFRNLGNSPKVEGSPSKNANDGQYAESSANVPPASTKKSKRTSLFRTLTGHNGNERDQDRPSAGIRTPTPQVNVLQKPVPVPQKTFENDRIPSGSPSKVSNKLQRASTSVAPEKNVGKKKRFSAIGTLFGRSKHDKPSSPVKLAQSRAQFQRPPEITSHQSNQYSPGSNQPQPQYNVEHDRAPVLPDFDHRSITMRQEPSDYYSPEQDYHPPQGGYYAPGRSSRVFSNQTIPQPAQTYARTPEPPAYMQDFSLRQSTSRSPPTSPPVPRAAAPSLGSYSNQAQPRQSHWMRNPALYSSNNNYPPHTDSGYSSNNYATHPVPTYISQPSWVSHSPPRTQSFQSVPNNYTPSFPPSTTYPSHNIPPHNSPPNTYNSQSYFPGPHPPRTASPAPPAPPPKDNYPQQHNPRLLQTHSPPPPPHFTIIATAPSHSPSPQPLFHHDSSSQSSTPTSRPHQSLPPLQTAGIPAKSPRDKNSRKSRQMEIERGGNSIFSPPGGGGVGGGGGVSGTQPPRPRGAHDAVGGPGYGGDGANDDAIVMSSTSYPGQEWTPSRYERWDGD